MAGHWYSVEDGHLYGQVPTLKGGLRDFSLLDAKKVNALPSVTGIISLLAKPGLDRWKVEQGIKAALGCSDEAYPGLSSQEVVRELFKVSEEYTNYTAEYGTAVHFWVNKKLRVVETLEIPPMVPGAEECADGVLEWCNSNGYEFTQTEHRFANLVLGYAGTIDLIGTRYGEPVIADLKTQSEPLTSYDEYALQLSGYALGCDLVDHDRVSLIADREHPGIVKQHYWIDHERWDRMWLLLVDYWTLANNYDPRIPA